MTRECWNRRRQEARWLGPTSHRAAAPCAARVGRSFRPREVQASPRPREANVGEAPLLLNVLHLLERVGEERGGAERQRSLCHPRHVDLLPLQTFGLVDRRHEDCARAGARATSAVAATALLGLVRLNGHLIEETAQKEDDRPLSPAAAAAAVSATECSLARLLRPAGAAKQGVHLTRVKSYHVCTSARRPMYSTSARRPLPPDPRSHRRRHRRRRRRHRRRSTSLSPRLSRSPHRRCARGRRPPAP